MVKQLHVITNAETRNDLVKSKATGIFGQMEDAANAVCLQMDKVARDYLKKFGYSKWNDESINLVEVCDQNGISINYDNWTVHVNLHDITYVWDITRLDPPSWMNAREELNKTQGGKK